MKKILLAFIAIASFAFTTNAQTTTSMSPEEMGKLHNEGLEYLFKNYGEQLKALKSQPTKLQSFIVEKTKEFTTKKGAPIVSFSEVTLKANFDTDRNGLIQSKDFKNIRELMTKLGYVKYDSDIIGNIFDQLRPLTTVPAFNRKIQELEDKANADSKIQNKEAVLRVLRVAKHSFSFWQGQNGGIQTLGQTEPWKADAAGAAGGALAGPWGVVAGAVICSAACYFL